MANKKAKRDGQRDDDKGARKAKTSNSTRIASLAVGAVAVVGVAWLWRTLAGKDGDDFRVLPIERVARAVMSNDRFLTEFSAQKPVVITGAWRQEGWRPAEITELCSDARIRTFKYDETSMTWARHVQMGVVPLQEYFDSFFVPRPGERPEPLLYGFEMELTKHCPRQLESMRIPSFLSEDVFHIVTNKTGLGWPSVLFGPEASVTGLHIDTHQLPFWIAVVAPKEASDKPLKRFRIFSGGDVNVLKYGQSNTQANMVFQFDPWRPDFTKFLDLREVSVYETELRSGEMLYIPGGSPHAVINLADNVGISMNFLDLKTFPSFARKCNNKSPLCGMVAGKGGYILDELDRQRQTISDQSYFQFAGIGGRQDFCQVHAESVRTGDMPALQKYCQD